MGKRKQFTFYESFYKALVKLPMEQAQQGLWAIVTYGLLGTLPEMEIDPAADAVFEMAKPVLDTARHKAEAVAASNKRRAKKNQNVQSDSNVVPMDVQSMSNNAQEKENENEVEIEKENEIEKESLLHTGSGPGVWEKESFEEFWEAYPLKLGKQRAFRIWKRDAPEPDSVMTALGCWKRSRKWRAEDGRYIPRAEKFLDEKHYEQPPKDAVPLGASGHLGKAEIEAIERLMNESD